VNVHQVTGAANGNFETPELKPGVFRFKADLFDVKS
jgi:hypothetical protein